MGNEPHDRVGKEPGAEKPLIAAARQQVRASEASVEKEVDNWSVFAEAAVKSRLLTREVIEERANQFLHKAGQQVRSARGFAKFLVQRKDVTKYQAERLLAGRTEGFFLGDCKILDVVGSGGMGKVYLAEQVKLGRQVAIKVLPADKVKDAKALARFLREARSAAELKHPNIVQIYDIGDNGGAPFIVMELVRGSNLKELVVQHGPMSAKVSATIIAQVAAGLQHAFEHGIVHRDIKPANIVQEDGTVKILDLGLARKLDDQDGLTEDGSGLGTPDYMSPEQFVDAHRADIRADLYSLGCTWYYLLCGHPPFQGSTVVSKGLAHMQEEATPIDTLVPSVSATNAAIIGKLMRKRPESRYQTPKELLDDVERLSSEALAETRVWPQSQRDAALVETASDLNFAQTLLPVEANSSESLITAPRTSVPAFLLHLLPVMGALVLGGAYFGIQAIKERGLETKSIVIDVPDRSQVFTTNDAPVQNPVISDPQSATNLNDDSVVQSQPPDRVSPPMAEAPNSKQDDATAEQPVKAVIAEVISPSPTQAVVSREPQRWTVATTHELHAAIEQALDGDTIEVDGNRPIEVEPVVIKSRRLTLTCTDIHRRPLLMFPAPSGNVASQGLVQIEDGGLTVENIDLYLDVTDRTSSDAEITWFQLMDADLRVVNCTVTVERGSIESRSPVVLAELRGERPWDSQALGEPPVPRQVSFQDCFVRGPHTTVFVNSRQAKISFENTIVCCPRELVHVFNTAPLEFAHQKLLCEIGRCTLDIAGPVFQIDCRPYDLAPVPLEISMRASWVLSPGMGPEFPPVVLWSSPVGEQTVSASLRWTADNNVYHHRSAGLQTKTPLGPLAILVESPDDWKKQGLGSETGWQDNRGPLKLSRSPWHQRSVEDYRFVRGGGADTASVAHPPRRPSKR